MKNPYAFPLTIQGVGGETSFYQEGMTLRDYFAGQALSALADPDWPRENEQIAEWAYTMADAMLAARDKS